MALVVGAFAEVASRFTRAGGTYLYARVAFGRFAGIEMAWLTYLVRLTAAATNANLFIIYLAEFWPRATEPV
jgi:amino acid transporter